MGKLIVVSDSHGSVDLLKSVIEREMPFDYIIHCGDGVGDLLGLTLPPGVVSVKVAGNVDLGRGYDVDRIEVREIGGLRIMVTHGDLFSVQYGYEQLLTEARQKGADAVFFGHTHKKFFGDMSPALFNPGPLNGGCYGVVYSNGPARFIHQYLDE